MNELLELLKSNQVLSTVASGGLIVWLITNLKSMLFYAKSFVISIISFVVYNNYTDERGFGHGMYDEQIAFDNIVTRSRTLWERTTNLDLSDLDRSGDNIDDCVSEKVHRNNTGKKIKAYGFSIRVMFGCIVFVNRNINKNQKITVDTSIRVFFGRKKTFLKRLNSEIDREVETMRSNRLGGNVTNVYYGSRSYRAYTKKMKRNIGSIFLDGDEHISLLEDIRKFIDNKDTYREMNYPYKYSALIYGVPGSGKTSTILSIATELDKDVEYVNLATTSSIELLDRMNENPERIFVFEDIDAIGFSATSNRSENGHSHAGIERCEKIECEDDDDIETFMKKNSGTISLSDLLNITDGLLSSDGTICIFTTNHKDRLDPAFLRVGRMNKTVEFRYMNGKTASRMVAYHLGVDVDGFRDEIKPAELQEAILDVKAGKKTIDDLKKEFS